MQERREQSRILYHRQVYLTISNGHTLSFMAHDFSMRGMGLVTDDVLQADAKVYVEFRIFTQDIWRDIRLHGRVVYSRASGDQFRSGVSFDSLR